MSFLREYWLYILIPFVLVLGGFLLLMWLTGDGDQVSAFQYNVF